MSTSFVNGRTFPRALSLSPPGSMGIPFVSVKMSGDGKMMFSPVIVKVDTGADRTFLTLKTARILGIGDPARGSLRKESFTVANGDELVCHMHRIHVDLSTTALTVPEFPVFAWVSDKLVNNLLGTDWLDRLCIAFDRHKVHFLFG